MRITEMNWMMVEEYLKGDDRCVLPLGSTEQHGHVGGIRFHYAWGNSASLNRLVDRGENNITVPFLSDFSKREVSAAYGVLNKDAGVANRATFVIDKEGKITYIEEGNTAIDPTGATEACSRSAHKAGQ